MFVLDFDKAADFRRTCSVEISEGYARILQLEKRSGSVQVRAYAEQKLEPGLVKAGIISNPEKVGQVLLQLLEDLSPKKLNTQYAICLIPQRHTFLTTVQLPDMDKEQLRSVIENKVEEIIPMPAEEIYWDWHRLTPTLSELTQKQKPVQIAAIPKELVDSYTAALNYAGLIPLLFEPSATAASRVVLSADNAEDKRKILIIETRDQYATVSLVRNKNIVFSTDTNWSEDADVPKRQLLIRQKVNELIEFASQNSSGKADQNQFAIVVYGEPEFAQSTIEELSQDSMLKVTGVIYKLESLQIFEFITKKKIDAYIPLIGSAIRGLPKYEGGSTLNLVPQSNKESFRRKELLNLLRRYLVFLAVNITLIVIALALVMNQLSSIEAEVETRYQSILALSQSPKVLELQDSIREINTTSTKLLSIIDKGYKWEDLLNSISAHTPAEIYITELGVEPYTDLRVTQAVEFEVTIRGMAASREAVIRMVDELRADGLLEQIKLPVDSLENSSNINFTIEARLPFEKLLNG